MANGLALPWPWPIDLIRQVDQIDDRLASLEVVDLILCIDQIMSSTGERARRVLSYFGTIDSVDDGNISYSIAYRIMCGNAPHDMCEWARAVESANNTGNLIEACLCLAHIVPLLAQRQLTEDVVEEHLRQGVRS